MFPFHLFGISIMISIISTACIYAMPRTKKCNPEQTDRDRHPGSYSREARSKRQFKSDYPSSFYPTESKESNDLSDLSNNIDSTSAVDFFNIDSSQCIPLWSEFRSCLLKVVRKKQSAREQSSKWDNRGAAKLQRESDQLFTYCCEPIAEKYDRCCLLADDCSERDNDGESLFLMQLVKSRLYLPGELRS